MKARATRREIPLGDRVFGVATSQGECVFRVPGHLARAPLSLLGDTDPAVMGCMIGLGWMHAEQDLEALAPGFRASREEWQAYGDAVLLELDDADWYPAEVDGLAAVLLNEWAARISVHGEAREKADFFEVTTGRLRSRRPTSSSDTSGADDSPT